MNVYCSTLHVIPTHKGKNSYKTKVKKIQMYYPKRSRNIKKKVCDTCTHIKTTTYCIDDRFVLC